MPYDQIKDLEPEEFKRFTGVHRPTFEKMVAVLAEHERCKKKQQPQNSTYTPLARYNWLCHESCAKEVCR